MTLKFPTCIAFYINGFTVTCNMVWASTSIAKLVGWLYWPWTSNNTISAYCSASHIRRESNHPTIIMGFIINAIVVVVVIKMVDFIAVIDIVIAVIDIVDMVVVDMVVIDMVAVDMVAVDMVVVASLTIYT